MHFDVAWPSEVVPCWHGGEEVKGMLVGGLMRARDKSVRLCDGCADVSNDVGAAVLYFRLCDGFFFVPFFFFLSDFPLVESLTGASAFWLLVRVGVFFGWWRPLSSVSGPSFCLLSWS